MIWNILLSYLDPESLICQQTNRSNDSRLPCEYMLPKGINAENLPEVMVIRPSTMWFTAEPSRLQELVVPPTTKFGTYRYWNFDLSIPIIITNLLSYLSYNFQRENYIIYTLLNPFAAKAIWHTTSVISNQRTLLNIQFL